MKRIISYMGAALIMVGLLQPVTHIPETPAVHAEQSTVISVHEEPKVITVTPVVEAPVAPTPPPAPVNPAPQPPTGTCADWLAEAGVSDLANATELIRRESGCNPYAINPFSGACGVAQELPCGKSGCTLGDGACQVKWMSSYVANRYGSWANAVAFHNQNNWY